MLAMRICMMTLLQRRHLNRTNVMTMRTAQCHQLNVPMETKQMAAIHIWAAHMHQIIQADAISCMLAI